MRTIEQISGFEWDAGNERKNTDKHGVSMGEAEEVFFNQPLLVLPDIDHSRLEKRFHALGKTNGCIFRLIPDTDSSRSRTPFRWEGGQHSVLKPDTIPVIPDTL